MVAVLSECISQSMHVEYHVYDKVLLTQLNCKRKPQRADKKAKENEHTKKSSCKNPLQKMYNTAQDSTVIRYSDNASSLQMHVNYLNMLVMALFFLPFFILLLFSLLQHFRHPSAFTNEKDDFSSLIIVGCAWSTKQKKKKLRKRNVSAMDSNVSINGVVFGNVFLYTVKSPLANQVHLCQFF